MTSWFVIEVTSEHVPEPVAPAAVGSPLGDGGWSCAPIGRRVRFAVPVVATAIRCAPSKAAWWADDDALLLEAA